VYVLVPGVTASLHWKGHFFPNMARPMACAVSSSVMGILPRSSVDYDRGRVIYMRLLCLRTEKMLCL
jgi:hypothetical protein